jgi:hypothetical protein
MFYRNAIYHHPRSESRSKSPLLDCLEIRAPETSYAISVTYTK